MRKSLFFIVVGISFIFLIDIIFMFYSLYQSSSLVQNTFTEEISYTHITNDEEVRVLFLGDSLAEGVGASNIEYSAYGRFAGYLSHNFSINFTNKAQTGNRVRDLIDINLTNNYDLIIVLISSNDLFRFSSLTKFEDDLNTFISQVSDNGERIIIVGPGRVFETRALPFWSLPIYKYRSTKYSDIISNLVLDSSNIVYINPLDDLKLNEYGKMEARDNFHPNDEGHRYWFDLIVLGWKEFV